MTKTISALPAAAVPADADLYETTQGGVSKKATLAQMKAAVGRGNVVVVDPALATATFSTTQTDATAAIQAAVDAAEAMTGSAIVVLPGGFLRTTATITIDSDSVVITGAYEAHGGFMFDIPASAGCNVRFHAAASLTGPVFDFTNGALGRRVYGIALRGVAVDLGTTGNHATIGVRIRSVVGGFWSFAVNRVQSGTTGVLCTTDPTLAATQGDTQDNVFEQVTVSCVNVAGNSGKCIHLTSGEPGSDTSVNVWHDVSLYYAEGHGIDLDNCDGEYFGQVRGNRTSASTSGRAVIFRNDPSGAGAQAYGRANIFVHLQPNVGGVEFEGNAGGTANAPANNLILAYSMENNGVRATWGTGAKGHIIYSDGLFETNGQSSPTVMNVYTSGSSTWTKPLLATTVDVVCIGGGGGGGSGRKGAAGTVRAGGGGGGGGGVSFATLAAVDLPATVNVTVGPGAAGGAAQTVNSTDGTQGAAGSGTNSGSYFGASAAAAYVRAGGGAPGLGGTATSGTGGSNGAGAMSSSSGGSASGTGGAGAAANSAIGGCSGGGAGGGITTGNAASAGGAGGDVSTRATATAPAGGAVDTAGTAATAPLPTSALPGHGGGGGGSSTTVNGGAGGVGARGGGGAGGGAAVDGVGNSGAGGTGGAGLVVVISRQ